MSMKDWERFKIPFEKIDVATEKFKTCIGRGGYGWVYKGILSIDGKDTTVAVKRLNEQFGQGLKEFLTEIQLLSGQQHPNLISLVGYCDEGKEKIIVYEYAARGSLDRYIRRNRDATLTTLTWLERLKICADAARGLDHLHNHIGGHRTIIHRDIKSSNILIDENWVAKISDLGLSKLSVTGFGLSSAIDAQLPEVDGQLFWDPMHGIPTQSLYTGCQGSMHLHSLLVHRLNITIVIRQLHETWEEKPTIVEKNKEEAIALELVKEEAKPTENGSHLRIQLIGPLFSYPTGMLYSAYANAKSMIGDFSEKNQGVLLCPRVKNELLI
ncbi:serine-threonine/tyrosine-protein kinase catalytic domain-containing protein [Artemisia annua]|uniref:Serine-threonine/tyrosine-protein kinase catalytic domain-containing protein n=1 Tax=Artemisia annua TaxID=35608 RepID=A0A2U1PPK7_ARTAN|nr:serine-threonine/tyrosine-protein kinase catalytic domain-containing protein [Artemisia annua]